MRGEETRFSNYIGDPGAISLLALTNLTRLDVSDNGVGSAAGIDLIAVTLSELTHLDISGKPLGAEGALCLICLSNLTFVSRRP